jgi:hypothetical protein
MSPLVATLRHEQLRWRVGLHRGPRKRFSIMSSEYSSDIFEFKAYFQSRMTKSAPEQGAYSSLEAINK